MSREKSVLRSTAVPLIRHVRYLINPCIAVWASTFFGYKRIKNSIKYLPLANKINFHKVTALKNRVLLLETQTISAKKLCRLKNLFIVWYHFEAFSIFHLKKLNSPNFRGHDRLNKTSSYSVGFYRRSVLTLWPGKPKQWLFPSMKYRRNNPTIF
jgi:hypothetical protein